MKIVKAVAPYIHAGSINFKTQAYEAWVSSGGQVAKGCYPFRSLHGLFFRYELPRIGKNREEARIRFVEPVSLSFDAFPDYARYEIIPFIWDCWPCYFDKICSWFKKHDVRTAIFTSSQVATLMQEKFPPMNIMYCPEGIDVQRYMAGKSLVGRGVDLLEFGRSNKRVLKIAFPDSLNHVCTRRNGAFLYTNEQLPELFGNSKVALALPRSMTQPDVAGNIETLTQRYWENMLSRIVMIGHAPKELVELVGYNPVIELDMENPNEQILDVVRHIDRYQELVDKNREVALERGGWVQRMRGVMDFLRDCGYEI